MVNEIHVGLQPDELAREGSWSITLDVGGKVAATTFEVP
jgi:hypothetical protein